MNDWTASDVEEALPRLRRYARSLTRDAGSADDLVQDALLRAFEKATSFRAETSVGSWLMAIVHNRFLDIERRHEAERRQKAKLEQEQTTHPSPGSDPEQSVYLKQVAARFADLPLEQRSVLHLVAVEGLSYQEVAQTLNLPVGTVMSRINRARERLRQGDAPRSAAVPLRIVGGRDES